MNKNSEIIKRIAYLGIGIALYVALGLSMNIPILAGSHLKTDLGYIAYGFCLYCFGVPALVVGVIGCFIESLTTSGWVPIGWMVGQAFIGIACGIVYNKIKYKYIHIIVTILSVFVGIALIKTGIECKLYSIPFIVKFTKNTIAFVSDAIPMIVGLILGYSLKSKILK